VTLVREEPDQGGAGELKPKTALSDQIDQKLQMLREQRKRAVDEASAGL